MNVYLMSMAAVHTKGLNWESLAVIVGAIAAVGATILTFLARRDTRNSKKNEELVKYVGDSINNMSMLLEAKLATNERVTTIESRVSKLEGKLETLKG